MIKLNGEVLEQNHFPDSTLMLKTDDYSEWRNIDIQWDYENDAELFTLICLAKKYKNSPKTLTMAYIPHARMDRIKHSNTEVFTLKYFCEVINDLNFNTVYVLDPHSNVSSALLNNCVCGDPAEYINTTINDVKQQTNDPELVLFFPDEGAMKRYSGSASEPYAFGIKNRNWETGQIMGLSIQNEALVKNHNILIIDDICSYGGTFVHAAKALKEAGANKIFLYITHCEANILAGGLYKEENDGLIEGVYTVGTLPALKKEIEADRVPAGPWVKFVYK